MSCRIVVPPPSFMSRKSLNKNDGLSPNKVSTVLTNLQRRNVQTQKVDNAQVLSIFQMAAQGELLLLQSKLESGDFNIDMQDPQGFSPLLWACANGQKATVELLLFHGANPLLTGDNGENGLLLAACRGHYDVVLYLLRAGVPVNIADELNNSALMFATFNNHVAIVSLLLDWGADITSVNGDDMDVMQFAISRNARSSQRVIEKHISSLLQNRPEAMFVPPSPSAFLQQR